MADRPDRPPGQRSLFDLCVKRVEKRPPPEVDRAEVEREMEALRLPICGEQPAPPMDGWMDFTVHGTGQGA